MRRVGRGDGLRTDGLRRGDGCVSGDRLLVIVAVATVVSPSVETCAFVNDSDAVSEPVTGVVVVRTAPESPDSKHVVTDGQLTERKVALVPVPSAVQATAPL